VRDVMTSPAITLPATATVAETLRLMAAHRVPQLPNSGSGPYPRNGHASGHLS
jgi:CBS domain-containing protein